jgi:poly(3-hydroxybutyrate) depolymerase
MSNKSALRSVARASVALLTWAATWCVGGAQAADPLGRFPVDPAQVSVSGISSGAFMANQLHIAHSAGLIGAGLIAGGLYGCAVDSELEDGVFALASLAVGPCMSVPRLLRNADSYARLTADFAAKGWIDPLSNIPRSRVYIFTGQADSVVNSKVIEMGASLYRRLGVPETQLQFHNKDLPGDGAGHSWVTKNFGNVCNANASPFINRCDYDQAAGVLQTIYGPLKPPVNEPAGRIVVFDQTEFVAGNAAAANGLSDKGYLYVPKACEPGGTQLCRLHLVLHGCLQAAEVLGDQFYTKIGVNEWADSNHILVLYPQAHATTVSELPLQNWSSLLNTNINGCWNWWGYAGDKRFLTKQGVQLAALWSMVRRITGQAN